MILIVNVGLVSKMASVCALGILSVLGLLSVPCGRDHYKQVKKKTVKVLSSVCVLYEQQLIAVSGSYVSFSVTHTHTPILVPWLCLVTVTVLESCGVIRIFSVPGYFICF